MDIFELLLIAVGLSMDAFAVSVCKGLSVQRLKPRHYLLTGAWFGGFQALMPLAGWALGKQFEQYIVIVDLWIAFLLLGWIGGKMIWDALHGGEDACKAGFDLKELFVLAVATSIDALAVGVTFAFLQVSILPAAALIGCTTFMISLAGVWTGRRFGGKLKDKAALAGGVSLCLIGLKILLEHLGML